MPRRCLAIDKRTGAVVGDFSSIKCAAASLGMYERTASWMCEHHLLGSGDVFLRTDWRGWEDVTGRVNRPVRCIGLHGEKRWYPTTRAAAAELGYHVSAITKQANGLLPPLGGRWTIEFVNSIGAEPEAAADY